MRYYKRDTFRHKIVRYSDIMSFVELFEAIASDNGGKNDFTINYKNGTSVSSSEREIFSAIYLRGKNIESIHFKYKSKSYENMIELQFREGYLMTWMDNDFVISSYDELWFNTTLAKMTDLLASLEKHHWLRRLFDFPIILISYFLFLILIFAIMKWPLGFEYGVKPVNAAIFIPLPLFYIGLTVLFVLISYITIWLFPEMEFDLDSPRSISRKRLRKIFLWVLGVIAIPVFLNFII